MKIKDFLKIEIYVLNLLAVFLFSFYQTYLNLFFLIIVLIATFVMDYLEQRYRVYNEEFKSKLEDLENKVSDLYLASGFVIAPKRNED